MTPLFLSITGAVSLEKVLYRSRAARPGRPRHPTRSASLCALSYPVILQVDRNNTIFRHGLDLHALEIDGQPPLQLVRAHTQDLDALVESDIRVVMLVEDGKAVVSRADALVGPSSSFSAPTCHTEHSRVRHMGQAPGTRGSPASRGWA